VDRKPERAVQAKIRGTKKEIYSWWNENLKRLSRKKLGVKNKKKGHDG